MSKHVKFFFLMTHLQEASFKLDDTLEQQFRKTSTVKN